MVEQLYRGIEARRRSIAFAMEQISDRTSLTNNDLVAIESSMLKSMPRELVENALVAKGAECQKRTLEIEKRKRMAQVMPQVRLEEVKPLEAKLPVMTVVTKGIVVSSVKVVNK